MRRVDVLRTYLEMKSPAELRGASFSDPGTRVEKRAPCSVATYRRLYKDVGEDWYWHDRLEWPDAKLAEYLARPTIGVWELAVNGESAGYFELGRHDDGSVEIVYFGLTPRFIGRRLGGPLLARATHEAWAMGANRVWLHTCTLDSERALPNYKARGFREFKTERLLVEIDGKDVVSEQLLKD